jgi:hypothetical protein
MKHREGSNLSRCKALTLPQVFHSKKSLQLERFDPSWRLIDLELNRSRVVVIHSKYIYDDDDDDDDDDDFFKIVFLCSKSIERSVPKITIVLMT